ncbi:DUF6328 family protein [Streptomyces aureus]|uniref:DUF6328 family protein n=1 Tax=Streptomyces aureus TaxID=193461 RepID=UPI00068B14EB|nr:DUF6328 family protein [Streptomyces aureus]
MPSEEGPPKRGGSAADGRDESPEERADRKWGDLLQEIRVAQTGVQILFGFLLTVVFQPSYRRLSEADQTLYMVTIVLGATAIGALVAPVAFHRIVTGRYIKPEAVVWASRLTLLGLLLLLLTMTSSLLLVLRTATHDDSYVPWIVAGVAGLYILFWLVIPAALRMRAAGRTGRGSAADDGGAD